MVMTINCRDHNFLVRIPNLVFLVPLESTLSVESIHINLDAIGGHIIAENIEAGAACYSGVY